MIDSQARMWYIILLNNFVVYPLRKCRGVPGINVGATLHTTQKPGARDEDRFGNVFEGR